MPNTIPARITRRVLMFIAILIVISAFSLKPILRQLRREVRAPSCRNDVWELYQGVRTYAAAQEGLVPPISQTRGNLMMDPDGFYPEYLTNSCWLQCEWSPARRRNDGTDKNDDLGVAAFNDDSFCYLPWAIRSEEEGMAFLEAYKSLDPKEAGQDLAITINGEQRVLPRIKLTGKAIREGGDEGGEAIPIIIEWPDLYHSGGTVCYANGLARTLKIGDEFPMTDAFISGLRDIASLDRPVPE